MEIQIAEICERFDKLGQAIKDLSIKYGKISKKFHQASKRRKRAPDVITGRVEGRLGWLELEFESLDSHLDEISEYLEIINLAK